MTPLVDRDARDPLAPRDLASSTARTRTRPVLYRGRPRSARPVSPPRSQPTSMERRGGALRGTRGCRDRDRARARFEASTPSTTPTLVVLDDVDVAGPSVAHALTAIYGDDRFAAAFSCSASCEIPPLPLSLFRLSTSPTLRGMVIASSGRSNFPMSEASSGCTSATRSGRHLSSRSRGRSEGIPGRVHEVVSDWTRTEASRRLSAAAEFLATGRDRHAADLEFANNAIVLKLGRLYTIEGRDVLAAEGCPYKGLAQFSAEDSAYFFGRERLVGELAARTVGSGMLGIVGASGSGKSSVVAAGLCPSLEAGLLPGSVRWRQVSLRPGEHPIAELRAALGHRAAFGDVTDPIDEALGELTAAEIAWSSSWTSSRRSSRHAGTRTNGMRSSKRSPSPRPPTRTASSWSWSSEPTSTGTVRPYADLATMLAENHVLVGPMSKDELRRAVDLPARRAGVKVETVLTDRLVEDVTD